VDFNQGKCRLLANARHSRDVIGRIPRKPLNIDHLVRLNPKFFLNGLKTNGAIFHGIPNSGLVGDQLHKILVPGDDNDRITLLFGQACCGPDEIISFKPRHFYDRQIECRGNLFDIRQLNHHVFRHGRPVGLVIFIHFMAKSGSFGIKKHGDIFRGTVFHELHEHAGKSENRIGRKSPGIGESPDGMVSAINIGSTVDEIEGLFFFHLEPCTSLWRCRPFRWRGLD